MATLQGKAVKNTYRQVLQIGANNVGVSGTLQPVQDGAGVNTALSLSTAAATVNGDLTVTGDLIITGGGLQIKELIDDTVAALIKNGTGITWTYDDAANSLTGNFTGTTSVVPEGTNLYFTNARSRTAISETITGIDYNNTTGVFSLTSGYTIPTTAAFNGKVPYTGATQDVNLGEFDLKTSKVWLYDAPNDGYGSIHLADGSMHFEDADGHTMFDIEDGFIQIHKDAAIQSNLFVTDLTATRNHNLPDQSGTIALTSDIDVLSVFGRTGNVVATNGDYNTTQVTEGTNLYWTTARGRNAISVTAGTGISYNNTTGVFNLAAIPNASLTNSSITINSQAVSLGSSVTLTTTNIAEGTNLYWTDARFDSRFGTKTTTNLAEGTNLYYTQARFNSALAAKTTTDLAEGTNLYYTDARSRAAISENAVGLDYSSTSGVLSLTSGYAIPTTVKLGQYDTAYNRSIVSAAVTGTGTKTLSLTQQDANVVTATWTDLGITTINGTANQIAATTVGNTTTLAFTNDVTMPNNLVVSGNLTINGTATYVNTQSISAKDPLFEVANDNNTTDAVDIGYYGRYYDTPQTRVEFTGLFRDASDAGKFKFFTGLVDEPTNVVNTSGVGYTTGTLVANFEGNLAGTANAANVLSTARSISATGDAAWTVNFDGSANATAALTLANTGVTATTYGTTTSVPTIAVDAKGRITSASNTNIAFPVTTVNGASGTVVLTTTNIAEGTNQYFTTGRAQGAISLTTTGTSGAATYSGGVFNIPTYIGGSGTANELTYFSTTGVISSLSTGTYPSLTELSYVKGVTSAIQTQFSAKANDNAVVHLAGTETITGSKTFSAALNGATATFTGKLTIGNSSLAEGEVAIFETGGNYNFTTFKNGTVRTLVGSQSSTSQGFVGTASNHDLLIKTNDTTRLAISSTGAATFNGNTSIAQGYGLSIGHNVASNTYLQFGYFAADPRSRTWRLSSDFSQYGDFSIAQATTAGGSTYLDKFTITYLGYTGINISVPQTFLHVLGSNTSGRGQLCIQSNNTSNAAKATWYYDTFNSGEIGSTGGDFYAAATNNFPFYAGGNERMRITSGGFLKASNTGTYFNTASPFHEFRSSAIDEWTVYSSNTSASPYGFRMLYANTAPNNTINEFFTCVDTSANRLQIRSNGGIANFQANNVNLSDERTKKDIIPLESYWDKFKAIEIVKFKYKDQTHDDFNIGVIAQQVEAVAPEFVDVEGWAKPELDEEGNEIVTNEEPLKAIYTADLHHATIKVLQEAMAKIEILEAEMAILKAK